MCTITCLFIFQKHIRFFIIKNCIKLLNVLIIWYAIPLRVNPCNEDNLIIELCSCKLVFSKLRSQLVENHPIDLTSCVILLEQRKKHLLDSFLSHPLSSVKPKHSLMLLNSGAEAEYSGWIMSTFGFIFSSISDYASYLIHYLYTTLDNSSN